MKRLFNVLLSLAILFSVVSAAAFLNNIIILMTTVGEVRRGYGYNDYSGGNEWEIRNLVRYMVYWCTGFLGIYIMARIVKVDAFWKNALIISFGYLLILGSYGGFELQGNDFVRLALSCINIYIFVTIYRKFEKKYYSDGIKSG